VSSGDFDRGLAVRSRVSVKVDPSGEIEYSTLFAGGSEENKSIFGSAINSPGEALQQRIGVTL
jgi:hypothetical protein